jgi:hypothetical protein
VRRLIGAFDRWVARSPVSDLDLAVYRIFYAGFLLLNPRRIEFALELPEVAWDPPWGPLRLLPAPPPEWVVSALAGALALSAGFLLFGWFTRSTSIALAVVQMALFGISYSYGKIDHTILVALVPLFLAWSRWGNRLSIDGLVDRDRGASWPVRLFALTIGLAFVTSALPKIRGGWLDPTSQAAQGHFLASIINGTDDGFRRWLATVDAPGAWELLDVATVAVELLLVVAVLNWRAFRIGLAVLALFHFGIMLTLGITFYANVLSYGVFVAWATVAAGSRLRVPDAVLRAARTRWLPLLLIALLAAGSWALGTIAPGALATVMNRTMVTAAGAIGAAFLLAQAIDTIRGVASSRPRTTAPA